MKTMKLVLVLAMGVFSFQFANAQTTVYLGNEDPCPTNFELIWELSGSTMVTTHLVSPNNSGMPVSSPLPGYQLTWATITRTSQSPVTIQIAAYPVPTFHTNAPCCTWYPLCDDGIETKWRTTSILGIAAH